VKPLIIAHRGWSARYPENTMSAIRAAIRLGVDMVEIDVQETRDGELVVFHDYRLDRIYSKHKRVCEALRKELPDAPTLREVLRLRFPLLIEIKGANGAKVAREIKRCQMVREVIVFSIKPQRMVELMKANPTIPRFGLAVSKPRSHVPVRGWGVSRHLIRTRSDVAKLHRHGKLFVWTVNQADEMRRLADWGVDGLITNHPDRARSNLCG
jgi:glycerophosphoryl diester phosphodiesterase